MNLREVNTRLWQIIDSNSSTSLFTCQCDYIAFFKDCSFRVIYISAGYQANPQKLQFTRSKFVRLDGILFIELRATKLWSAENMGSNPVEALIFFRALFATA